MEIISHRLRRVRDRECKVTVDSHYSWTDHKSTKLVSVFFCTHPDPYRPDLLCAESVTRARVHDKRGKKIAWVRFISIQHFTRTELSRVEILRQGLSTAVILLIIHLLVVL